MSAVVQEPGTLTDTIGTNDQGLSVPSVVQNAENQEGLMPAVYDAAQGQAIESYRIVGNKRYKVTHLFDAMSDDVQAEYFKRLKLYFERDAHGGLQTDMDNDAITAAIYLHDAVAIQIKGIDLTGVKDWKAAIVSPQSKQDFVNNCLLFCEVLRALPTEDPGVTIEIVDAAEGELCPVEINPSEQRFEYAAILRFNGKEVMTHHTLRGWTGAEQIRYSKLNSKSSFQPMAGGRVRSIVPAKAMEMAKFYDDMIEEKSGFVGRVPLFVKKAVAEFHLSQIDEQLRGN